MKRNQGYTLVELLVSIAVGSLVTLAATTVLLLGLRIHNRSTATVIRQNTARVVLTMLENLAAEGDITSIEVDENNADPDAPKSWRIRNAENVILASFDADKAAIYAGIPYRDPDGNGEPVAATPILENVSDSTIGLDTNGVLTVSVTTEDGTYESKIYCRTLRAPAETEPTVPSEPSEGSGSTLSEGRKKFLNVLASQYRLVGGSPNPGLILDNGYSTGQYYTQWYVGGTYPEGWSPETPWCACFVSWALCYPGENSNPGVVDDIKGVVDYIDGDSWNVNGSADKPKKPVGVAFASVDKFWDYFNNLGGNGEHWKDDSYVPTPGDIIFIDWSGGNDPAHVGVVLKVETDTNGLLKTVYTIEGNMENRVMIRRYVVGDNYGVVMGYGIIDWTG